MISRQLASPSSADRYLYILSPPDAPDADPNMSIAWYDRDHEQNEELGLNDMIVEVSHAHLFSSFREHHDWTDFPFFLIASDRATRARRRLRRHPTRPISPPQTPPRLLRRCRLLESDLDRACYVSMYISRNTWSEY